MKYSDLAAECRELLPETEALTEEELFANSVTVKRIKIDNPKAAEELGCPIGNYSTLELEGGLGAATYGRLTEMLLAELRRFIPEIGGTVLVAGLGNRSVTPDSLGPRVAAGVMATRHISEELKEKIGLPRLNSVAVIAPGVLGQTGIETAETVCFAAKAVKAAAVITVDALTARSPDRLCSTLQITDAGVSPGSGVGNRRAEISAATLGIPVISLGVPTVVNAEALFAPERNGLSDMLVTPKDIDSLTDAAAEIISDALNRLLQPSFEPELSGVLGL